MLAISFITSRVERQKQTQREDTQEGGSVEAGKSPFDCVYILHVLQK